MQSDVGRVVVVVVVDSFCRQLGVDGWTWVGGEQLVMLPLTFARLPQLDAAVVNVTGPSRERVQFRCGFYM